MELKAIRSALQGNNSAKQFITITELANCFGTQTRTVRRYVDGLDVVGGKYYLINEVAKKIREETRS